jgi:CheY-like chemotaxis protein
MVVGDSGRLRQILLNLTSNAIKFTESGEVAMEVTIAADNAAAEPGTYLAHFSVRDTGIGIPADKQRTIFEAFTQVDNSTSRRYGGTGLGLTISSRLVKAMGGKIWVESRSGHGSTFHFTVRFGLPTYPEAAHSAKGASVLHDVPHLLEALKILLVEDTVVNQKIATHVLKKKGHFVTVACDGQQALQTLKRSTFDLVLMDVQMPVMDGFEATAAIREREKSSGGRLPIIAMTAHALKGDADKCLQAGMDGYISKPFQPQTVFDEIRRVMERTSRASGNARVQPTVEDQHSN